MKIRRGIAFVSFAGNLRSSRRQVTSGETHNIGEVRQRCVGGAHRRVGGHEILNGGRVGPRDDHHVWGATDAGIVARAPKPFRLRDWDDCVGVRVQHVDGGHHSNVGMPQGRNVFNEMQAGVGLGVPVGRR
jgi:hypothetical protein